MACGNTCGNTWRRDDHTRWHDDDETQTRTRRQPTRATDIQSKVGGIAGVAQYRNAWRWHYDGIRASQIILGV